MASAVTGDERAMLMGLSTKAARYTGVVGERIQARYYEAADTVFLDGSSPWEIDEAMVEFGYALGPYATQDLIGLDIEHAKRRCQDAHETPQDVIF